MGDNHYRYTIAFLLSIIIAIILKITGVIDWLVGGSGLMAYLEAGLAGMFFSSTLTAATATVFFLELGEAANPFVVVVIGGAGAMVGDLLMYRFVKDQLLTEIRSLLALAVPVKRLKQMENFTKRRVFFWTVPFLASLLIASPLPDELGVALFGLINFKSKYLSVIAFTLNTIGIAVLVFLGHTVG